MCLSKAPIILVILLMQAFVKATMNDVPNASQKASIVALRRARARTRERADAQVAHPRDRGAIEERLSTRKGWGGLDRRLRETSTLVLAAADRQQLASSSPPLPPLPWEASPRATLGAAAGLLLKVS